MIHEDLLYCPAVLPAVNDLDKIREVVEEVANFSSNNTVVYTAIFDSYDTLAEPLDTEANVDYICFTNCIDGDNSKWQIININIPDEITGSTANRYLKIHPHLFLKEYEYSVYIDGNVQLLNPVRQTCINSLCTSDIAAYRHSSNNSVREEAKSVIKNGISDKSTVRQQMGKYFINDFPDDRELTTNRVLYRRHNSETCIKIMNHWWEEMKRETQRDQLSLNYVL